MWLDDLRYSLRVLRHAPLTTITIILTVALGIGATTAVFSVVNAVLLRPLPYVDPGRLVWVAERNDKLNLPTFSTSGLNFQSWLADRGPVESLGAVGYATYNLLDVGEPEQLNGGTLTASVFGALGLVPVAGRTFIPADQQLGAAPVAMISAALWHRRYGADPALLGRAIHLNGTPYTLVGIAPAALNLISPGDVWTPMAFDPAKEKRLSHLITAIGRLRDGVTLQQAQLGMDAVARRVGEQFPEVKDWGIRLVPFPEWIVPDQVRTVLLLLLFAVLTVLLIAAANIANLLLARALRREQEVALRATLGASRGRVLRQLLIESLVLAAIGGILGSVAAFVTVRAAGAALPPNLLPVSDIGMDGKVLAFALSLSLVTGLLFGLVPAWQIASSPVSGVLRASGKSALGGGRRKLRNGLATAEIALAAALLVVAGLLLQSARHLGRVELGFDPGHLLTFQVSLPGAKDPTDTRPFGFYRDLVPALAAVPGATGAAVSSGVPFGAGNYTATPVHPVGASQFAPDDALTIDWRLASPEYFRVMGIPLLRGRGFTEADEAGAPPVMLVSRSMAEKFWGDADPLGRAVQRVADDKTFTVIGVVGDVRLNALNQQTPTMYFSTAFRLWPLMDVVVRTSGEPESVLADVRRRIHSLDPGLPISNVRPMTSWVAASGAQPRLDAGLLAVFSALALVIATLGIYGVLAHSVAQRTGEIGLRMALGAPRGRVVRELLREGMIIGGIGIALGLAGALAAGPVLKGLVFGVTTYDVATMALVSVLLAAVTLVACFVPARRAARVDPAISLRNA
ncbi:MAG TPA: ABC transporter permease [Thermoanaerobaculia bacterium]|jgi:putative ABC transport system permease protein|nr:ABC transporter permease [Thermoanaerobaculia bacterium]